MLRFMLDTDTCIHVLRDRPVSMRERFRLAAGGLCISTVTLSELLFGALNSAQPEAKRAHVEALAGRLEILSYDDAAADHFSSIKADLKQRGCLIGPYDVMIAAHARSLGLMLVTGNLREFRRVEGLRCENWLEN
ncbi:tRNA(fMet)-specific endonuclease VapC [Niveispirillum sp.]|uniref:tRNA(fMet)-specific endonuclease VapC n=1 Tax=Niveispirillum sp. TaxID=1917217 RepID=UPI001B6C80E1|nr:tRNA(fMet)-specific endonuclease VapC [Niveispirillum sp.]MBP7334455.1 tRNA(fMet)-specific endonuclease VapC [Niveispirillum sp.]